MRYENRAGNISAQANSSDHDVDGGQTENKERGCAARDNAPVGISRYLVSPIYNRWLTSVSQPILYNIVSTITSHIEIVYAISKRGENTAHACVGRTIGRSFSRVFWTKYPLWNVAERCDRLSRILQ